MKLLSIFLGLGLILGAKDLTVDQKLKLSQAQSNLLLAQKNVAEIINKYNDAVKSRDTVEQEYLKTLESMGLKGCSVDIKLDVTCPKEIEKSATETKD